MKLEQQVVSLELAQKLKELKVEQKSLFYWVGLYDGDEHVEFAPNNKVVLDARCSAFTVAELGEVFRRNNIDIETYFRDEVNIRLNDKGQFVVADTEADARAKMLVYLLENNLITL